MPLDPPIDPAGRDSIRATLLEKGRALGPMIRERAGATERARRVSDETIEALKDSGVFRAWLPRRFGGYELDFGLIVELDCVWGAGCASTAWVVGLGMVHQWLIANYPLEAQEEMWRDDPDTLAFGSYKPSGKCVRVSGGYRLSGSFMFSSGCDVGQWALLAAVFPPAREGEKPMPGFALVPRRDWTIDDNWHAVGLCGSGSKNIVCDEAFVPEHRRLTFAELNSGASPGARVHASPLYRIPLLALIPFVIACPALGALRGAIDDFIAATRVRETRGAVVQGGVRMAEFATVQARIAEAEACYRSVRLMALADIADTHATVERGDNVTIDQRIRNRLTQAYLVKQSVEGVDRLFAASGGMEIFTSGTLQRAWRDVHAVAKHVSLNWDAVSTMYGQNVLGLEPQGQY